MTGLSTSLFGLSDSANAFTSVLSTASTEAIFINAQIASQNAVERAFDIAQRDQQAEARNNPEDQIDFSEQFRELLERANAQRVDAVDRKIEDINEQIEQVAPFRSDSDEALRLSAEYRLDLVEAELRRLNIVGNEDPAANARRLSSQADGLKIAIDEYRRSIEPEFEDLLASGTIEPTSFQDEQFRERIDKLERTLTSRIRSQTLAANSLDIEDRIDVQGRLNNAKQSLRGLGDGLTALDEVLAIKRNAAVDIVV